MVQKQSLCPDPLTHSPTNDWCFYEAYDSNTITVQIVFMGCMLVLSVLVAVYYCTIKKYNRDRQYKSLVGDQYLRMYYLIIAWLLCSMFKVGINIAIYFAYMYEQIHHEQDNYVKLLFSNLGLGSHPIDSPIVVFSTIFLAFDFLTTFFVLNLILIIPCHWLNMVLLNTNQNKDIELGTRKLIQNCFKILKGANIYKYIRILFAIFLLLQPPLLYFTNVGCGLPKINTYIVMGQTLLIFLFYIFGFIIAEYMSKKKLIKLATPDYKRIRVQYFLLVSVLIIRIILNFYFRLSNLIKADLSDNCVDRDVNNSIPMTVFLTLGHSIMHLLPIGVVMFIYRPSKMHRDSELSDELLMSGEEDININKSKQSGSNKKVRQRQRLSDGRTHSEGQAHINMSKQQSDGAIDRQACADILAKSEG